jgi:DNA-binding beta-propeller fold protein YncE
VQTSSKVVEFPGGIVIASGRLYVSDYGLYPDLRNIIMVLDPGTLQVLDSVRVGFGAGMMVHSSGMIYSVSGGIPPSNGMVYVINASTSVVVDSLAVGPGPSDIALLNETLYVLHSTRVMKLIAFPLSVGDSLFAALSNALYYYSLAVDRLTGDVYVSKVTSSGGSGQVEIYTAAGTPKRQPFEVGTFPGAFAFKP